MTLYKQIAPGIYRDARKMLWERPWINGRRTWRRLHARSVKLAKEEVAARRSDQGRARLGLAVDPYVPQELQTVGDVLAAYQAAGFPDRHGLALPPDRVARSKGAFTRLWTFWQTRLIKEVTPASCRAYFASITRRRGESGRRSTDLELTLLASALRFAVSEGNLARSPFADGRPRFVISADIRHCRETAPTSTTELHRLAAMLFESRRSEALGWQTLFEAFTGCRTSEAVALRMDAKPGKAGFIEGDWLWLERKKKGVNPFALIHDGLQALLAAHKTWHRAQFPGSPWFFPGRTAGEPVTKTALVHALRRIAPLASGAPRTSHGLRAFFVTARRSQGISDGQIAAEIGDKSGPALIASTYGAIPPNWSGGKTLTWLPQEHPPAWAQLLQELTRSPVHSPPGRLPLRSLAPTRNAP